MSQTNYIDSMFTVGPGGTGDVSHLQIFDSFSTEPTITINSGWGTIGSNLIIMPGRDPVQIAPKRAKRFFGKLLKKLSPKAFNTWYKPMSIQKFFYSLINESVNLKNLGKRITSYERVLKQAEENGQEALADQLLEQIDLIRKESILYASGIRKVITEDQLLEFRNKTRKGYKLNLTWLKNFTRIIPEKVLEKKKVVEELDLFDDFAILHYDPNIGKPEHKQKAPKAVAKTKSEIERERDPILFGIINDVRKLYYIADWKDKYCSLTMDEIVKKLGKKKASENDISSDVKVL